MSEQTFNLDESELAYSVDDLKTPSLKTGQIYQWQIVKTEAKNYNGRAVFVLDVAPVTSSDSVLKQFTQKVFVTIPVKSLGEKLYPMYLQRFQNVLQAFAAPTFNAFGKVEVVDGKKKYYDAAGNELDRAGRAAAQEEAKKLMMEARATIGQYLEVGQRAYALFKEPREGSEWPSVGNFTQSVSPESQVPFADEFADMVS